MTYYIYELKVEMRKSTWVVTDIKLASYFIQFLHKNFSVIINQWSDKIKTKSHIYLYYNLYLNLF